MSPLTPPRPILKRQLSPSRQVAPQPILPSMMRDTMLSPHVHFPPTPCLVVSTHPAHSPRTYDRKPILVSPNSCDLSSRNERKLYSPPAGFEVERKERGRGRSRRRGQDTDVKGSYFHPRAFEACEPEPFEEDILLTPPLMTRRSSYSDDSDSDDSDAVSTPPDPKLAAALPQIQRAPSSPSNHPATYASHVAGLHHAIYVEDKHRPQLSRAQKQPTITIVSSTSLDEGCLGGF